MKPTAEEGGSQVFPRQEAIVNFTCAILIDLLDFYDPAACPRATEIQTIQKHIPSYVIDSDRVEPKKWTLAIFLVTQDL